MQHGRPDRWVARGLALAMLGVVIAAVLTNALNLMEPPTWREETVLAAPQHPTPTLDPVLGETIPLANDGGPAPDGLKPLAVDSHPLSIAAMRQHEYPGSSLTFEQTLAAGPNYNQYIVSYQSEGLKIYGLLSIPFGERPASGWPAIVFNHGYIPPDEYRTTERYVAYFAAFAQAGYITLKPDYRGHGDSEGQARSAYFTPDYTVDVLNAAATLRAYPDVDPNRLGMWGHSMGGYITLRAMVIDPTIKAGVIWGGVVASYPDLFTLWWRPREQAAGGAATPSRWGRWRQDTVDLYGTPEENPAFWNAISANSYLADLSGPVQLHHSTTDEVVPYALSEVLYKQVLEAGQLAELYAYLGDNHNISANLQTALTRSVVFFDVWVKGAGG